MRTIGRFSWKTRCDITKLTALYCFYVYMKPVENLAFGKNFASMQKYADFQFKTKNCIIYIVINLDQTTTVGRNIYLSCLMAVKCCTNVTTARLISK